MLRIPETGRIGRLHPTPGRILPGLRPRHLRELLRSPLQRGTHAADADEPAPRRPSGRPRVLLQPERVPHQGYAPGRQIVDLSASASLARVRGCPRPARELAPQGLESHCLWWREWDLIQAKQPAAVPWLLRLSLRRNANSSA